MKERIEHVLKDRTDIEGWNRYWRLEQILKDGIEHLLIETMEQILKERIEHILKDRTDIKGNDWTDIEG